jgi:hypothetical protein
MDATAATSIVTEDVVHASGRTFAVQVRYPRSADWVTIARHRDHRAALREAAAAYRNAIRPDGWTPSQVRLVEF